MKKALLMGLSLVMVAAIAIFGTMAYFTSEDSDVNVMTLGNVSIEQIEQEWNEDETALQDFTQAKPLYPYVGTLGWENETENGGAYRRFTMNNVVDKYVSVKNIGTTDAYVRTIIALEMGDCTYDELGNLVGVSVNAYNGSEFQFEGAWDWTNDFVASVDGKNYNIMVAVHKAAVEPGDTTIPSLLQVYLSKNATNEDVEALDGNDNGTYDILVLSQAVQTAGFADAKTALDDAFGEVTTNAATWFGGDEINIPVTVSSADDMYAALDAGETDIVVKGATISENLFNGRYYKDRNIDFVDCTFTANMNYMYINDATFTNCTFDCGSANSAVHYDELFGDLVFNNCTFISGKIQIGANKDVTGTVTFNDCVFAETNATSIWAEKGIRVYSPAEFNDCEFNNRVVLAGSNGLSLTFNSCTMNGGTPVFYIDNSNGIIRGGNIPAVTINGETSWIVKTASELQDALDDAVDGDVIVLGADITGEVTATQKENVKITIDGNGKTYVGTITVDGKSAHYETTALTIQNVNFSADALTNDAYINLGKSGDTATRYTNNVTISNCTFAYSGTEDKVAIKSYTGGDWNLTIEGCTVNGGMHSMLQVTNVEKGLTITDCEVKSKNGINLNNTPYLNMSECKFDTQGYCVRIGVNGSTNSGDFTIADSILKSANDDNDAVIILRGTMTGATLTLDNVTLTGTPDITGEANVVKK